jgi:hypothetical protein
MTTLNLHAARGFSKIFSKMGGAAAAVALLAAVALSSPTRAATFTLQELLDNPAGFTVGNLQIFDFGVSLTGEFLPEDITVQTVDSLILPGFVTQGNGFLKNDEITLNISFRVADRSPEIISGALLWLTEFTEIGTPGVAPGRTINIDLITLESGMPNDDLLLQVFVDSVTETEVLSDAGLLPVPVRVQEFRSELTMAFPGEGGEVSVGSYATLFTRVVPEPGTASLLGLGLAGLGVVGRSRREESKATA